MTSKLPKYLDYASTTPLDDDIVDSMMPYFAKDFGNASSKDHVFGKKAKDAIEFSRGKVAALIGAESDEIIFTSGATEAINIGIIGYYLKNRSKGNHIITVATEHKAVLETFNFLEHIGARVTKLNVDSLGLIDFNDFNDSISDDTIMVSVMHTNNETGVIQKISLIADLCQEKGIIFFCDASQAVGKIDINLLNLPIDLLCISGHKMYGPKGVGALFIRRGVGIEPIMHGGGQEKSIRPGTYNTPLIVGLGKACEIAKEELKLNYEKAIEIRNFIEEYFIQNNLGKILSDQAERSPYITSISLKYETAEEFIIKNRKYISISSGSACNSEIVELSHVILNMFHDPSIAERTVRLSYSKYLNVEDLKKIIPFIA